MLHKPADPHGVEHLQRRPAQDDEAGRVVAPWHPHRLRALAVCEEEVHVADERRLLEAGSADNLKRVHLLDGSATDWYDDEARTTPWTIEPFTEMKTIWHPSGA